MQAFLDNLRLAARTFLGNPLRSLLTLLGIVIGVTTVIAMMAMIEGLRQDVNDQMSSLGADSFQVTKRGTGFGRRNWDKLSKRPNLTLADRDAILKRCPTVRAAAAEDFEGGFKLATSLRETRPNVSIWAVTANFTETNGVNIAAGRTFTDQEVMDGSRVVLLGLDVVDTLFPSSGDPVGQEVRIRGQPFKVIGLVARRGGFLGGGGQDNQAVMPLSTFRTLVGNNRSVEISMAALGPELISKAQDEVMLVLRQRRNVKVGEPNNFEFFSNASTTEMFNNLSNVIRAASFGVCLLSLLVGGLGILNIMLVSVTERTKEIGIRKALGAKRRTILAQFAIEAVTLSLVGGVIGIALGSGVSFLGRWVFDFPTSVPAWSVVVALAMSSGVGLAFGIYPAARAAKLDPTTAMRSE
ncbi:MAG: ABC transporter permease [Myxococcaceae bacterium]